MNWFLFLKKTKQNNQKHHCIYIIAFKGSQDAISNQSLTRFWWTNFQKFQWTVQIKTGEKTSSVPRAFRRKHLSYRRSRKWLWKTREENRMWANWQIKRKEESKILSRKKCKNWGKRVLQSQQMPWEPGRIWTVPIQVPGHRLSGASWISFISGVEAPLRVRPLAFMALCISWFHITFRVLLPTPHHLKTFFCCSHHVCFPIHPLLIFFRLPGRPSGPWLLPLKKSIDWT